MPFLPCKAAQWKVRLISGKPDTSRGVRPVWRGAFGNLPQKCGKAPGAYLLYAALAPLPLATFAGESTQSVGVAFVKGYAGVCLEGAVIVLACIIYAGFVNTPSVVTGEATTIVWSYLAETIFNMLVLVGLIKGSDRIIHEMMGL